MTPMLCQLCGQNPATIHFTEIKESVKRELHICEECAEKKNLTSSGPLPPMLFELMQSEKPGGPEQDVNCPHCGITFSEFRSKGRLGCPHDYEVFAEPLRPLLEKIHGSSRHVGRLPRGRTAIDGNLADRLMKLRRELHDSVKTENYEHAARLRDQIAELEEAGGGAPGAGSEG